MSLSLIDQLDNLLQDTLPPLPLARFENDLTNDKFYKYVSKNRTLPLIRSELRDTVPGRNELIQLDKAIQNEDFTNEIFQSPRCLIAIQTLFELGAISENQRVTLCIFISALQSHTTMQPLRESDQHIKELLDVQYISISNSNYEPMLDAYLDQVLYKLKRTIKEAFSHEHTPKLRLLNKITLKQALANLVPSEQAFITIAIPNYCNLENGSDEQKSFLLRTQATSVLDTIREGGDPAISAAIFATLFSEHQFNELIILFDKNIGVIPSASLFYAICQSTNLENECFKLSPMLGNIGLNTLYSDFIIQKQRPLAIYCQYIFSNPKNVHDYLFGPLAIALHDLFHASMLGKILDVPTLQLYTEKMLPFFFKLLTVFLENKDFHQNNPDEIMFLNAIIADFADGLKPMIGILLSLNPAPKKPLSLVSKITFFALFLAQRDIIRDGFNINLDFLNKIFEQTHGTEAIRILSKQYARKTSLLAWTKEDLSGLCEILHNYSSDSSIGTQKEVRAAYSI